MSKTPEGWGENRHAPAAATAEGQRDTIGVWSAYNLPQKYIDVESKRASLEASKMPNDPSPFGWSMRGNKSSLEELSRSSSAVTRTVASVNLQNNFAFLTPPPDNKDDDSSIPSSSSLKASAPSELAMKLNSVKSSRKIEDVDSQPDQSAVILKMLVSAVLEMDARMKRMEAMLEILTLKAEK